MAAEMEVALRSRPRRATVAKDNGGKYSRPSRSSELGAVLTAVVIACAAIRCGVNGNLCIHEWDTNDCMECEKILIDGRDRIISFCKQADKDTTDPAKRREVSVKDVFWDPINKRIGERNEGMYIYQWKSALRECRMNASLADLRQKDFLTRLQETSVNVPSAECNRIADYYCQQLGYGKNAWVDLPLDQCCNISKDYPAAWRFTNPEIWHCTCGSGVRRDHEGCDDGNVLNEDGCSSFCSVEEELGYFCEEPEVELDYTDPEPPSRASVCNCNCDCSLECTCQNKANRDYCGVRDDGSLVEDTEFICCDPYVGD